MTVEDSKRFWDRTAEKYSKSKISDQAGYEKTLEKTKTFLKSSDRVLELGCGTGSTALILAPHVQRYLATDLSPGMIKIAEAKSTADTAIPGLEFRATTAETLSKEATRYNVILGFNYLHLVHDTPATLQSIHTVLDEKGLFVTKTPCVGEMNSLLRWVAIPVMQAVGMAPDVQSFTPTELKQQLASAGFEILVDEIHASKGNDKRPYIVARKR
jgi:ubiquinone/menaquinone biosynthesis C-methylase UbiE